MPKRKRNKEYDKRYMIEWRKKNPDRVRELSKKSYWKHHDKRRKEIKERYRNDPVYRRKHRAQNREWLYGITQEQYDILVEIQNGLCAICGADPSPKSLYIDHSHVTGKVRGLLCLRCNSAIGLAKENLDTLEKMRQYLQNHA